MFINSARITAKVAIFVTKYLLQPQASKKTVMCGFSHRMYKLMVAVGLFQSQIVHIIGLLSLREMESCSVYKSNYH